MKPVVVLVCVLLSPLAAVAQGLFPLPDAGNMIWGNWAFQYDLGDTNEEGLVIRNVTWKGISVLYKGSLPVVRVKYRGDGSGIEAGCGPYRDRIGWLDFEPWQGTTTRVIGRIFDDTVLEIAIFATVGGYYLYQAWYFHTSGRLEPVLYSKGWTCHDAGHENDHRHHPYWRLDFDVEEPDNEAWVIRTKSGGQTGTFKFPTEWNDWKLPDDEEVAWSVNKPGSRKHVLIRSPANEERDASAGSPWFNFSYVDAAIRRYHDTENEPWPFEGSVELGYITPAESLTIRSGNDLVFWSVGHLSHTWSANDVNNPEWHSAGLIVDAKW